MLGEARVPSAVMLDRPGSCCCMPWPVVHFPCVCSGLACAPAWQEEGVPRVGCCLTL